MEEREKIPAFVARSRTTPCARHSTLSSPSEGEERQGEEWFRVHTAISSLIRRGNSKVAGTGCLLDEPVFAVGVGDSTRPGGERLDDTRHGP